MQTKKQNTNAFFKTIQDNRNMAVISLIPPGLAYAKQYTTQGHRGFQHSGKVDVVLDLWVTVHSRCSRAWLGLWCPYVNCASALTQESYIRAPIM